jgi:uncharacterized protein
MPGTLPTDVLSVLPAEDADITFVDAEGYVRYFSEYRIFSRPLSCLDAPVLECHSEDSRPGIESMLAEFRDGWRDEASFLAHNSGRLVDVRYVAVRDIDGTYLGCVEVAQWAPDSTS